MKRRIAFWLARLYPAVWRERYGEEFDALVEDSGPGWRGLADIAWAALAMQWREGLSPALTVLVGGFAGMVLAIPAALAIPDVFVSDAVFKVAGHGGDPAPVGLAIQGALRRENLVALLERRRLYARRGEGRRQDEFLTRLQQNISVSGVRQAGFSVSFAYEDAAVARDVTEDLTGLIMAEFNRNHAGHPRLRLDLIDPASLPRQPAWPNRPVAVFVGLAAGAALGALVSLARRGGPYRLARAGAVGALIGALVVILGVAYLQRVTPLALVSVIELKGDSSTSAFRGALERSREAVMSDRSLAAIVGGAPQLRAALGIMLSRHDGTAEIQLAFSDKDNRLADAVLREATATFIVEFERQRRTAAASLEPPRFPGATPWPRFPDRFPHIAWGALIGSALSIFLAGFRRKLAAPQPVF